VALPKKLFTPTALQPDVLKRFALPSRFIVNEGSAPINWA
jgi:hypothetical protein